MSAGSIGHGTTLGYSTVAGGPYTDFAEVVSVKEGAQAADKVDFTHLTSTSRRKEFKLGMIDSGEWQFTLNTLYAAERTAMRTAHSSGATYYWRCREYDTSATPSTLLATLTFAGPVMNFDDGTREASSPKRTTLTIAVTGAITEV